MDAHRRRSPSRRTAAGTLLGIGSGGRGGGGARAAAAMLALLTVMTMTLAACGSFSATTQAFTAQPSLTDPMVTPIIPLDLPGPSDTSPTPGPSSATPSSTSASSQSVSSGPARAPGPSASPDPTRPTSSSSTRSSRPPDPCAPTDPAVVAACLTAPWGLAPLPDGVSALVGERTTGRILKVAAGTRPALVTTVTGIDAKGDGGLLGLAVSPSYAEDGLIYAYVTTATDNRIIRIAVGDPPKPILSGIPKGANNNGGAIGFTADGTLYVGTGNVGSAGLAARSTSLAGKLLRLDQFGKPAAGDPMTTSSIFSSGFTQITGLCLLPTGAMAALDHRRAADVLLPARSGTDYTDLRSGDAVWTWKPGDGGAADCATADGQLVNTSLAKRQLTGIAMSAAGTFSGSPRVLMDNRYGRLLTVQPGAKGAVWMTTSNKDGHGKPVASDDRVILLPNAGSAGGEGPQ